MDSAGDSDWGIDSQVDTHIADSVVTPVVGNGRSFVGLVGEAWAFLLVWDPCVGVRLCRDLVGVECCGCRVFLLGARRDGGRDPLGRVWRGRVTCLFVRWWGVRLCRSRRYC